VLGGTDYAPNMKGIGFGKVRKVVLSSGETKADDILSAVCIHIVLNSLRHSSKFPLYALDDAGVECAGGKT
jgi:hypothetical protein